MSEDDSDSTPQGDGAGQPTRRAPLRPKAQATVERILDATAALLDEAGLGVTTNRIAAAAGINVATLYQYFPNKEAVFVAVLHRHLAWRLERVSALLSGLGRNSDWRGQVQTLIGTMVARRDSEPGIRSLRLAMRASPELRDEHHAATLEVARVVADELRRGTDLGEAEAHAVALCAMESLVAVLDLREAGVVEQPELIERQAHELVTGFLAHYLDGPSASAG